MEISSSGLFSWKRLLASPIAVSFLLLATSSTTSLAHSSKPHPFKEASISLENLHNAQTTLRVGHDGEKYTHIEDSDVVARFRLKAKVKSGHRIVGFVLTTGDPENKGLLTTDVIAAEKRLWQRKFNSIANFRMDVQTALKTGVWGSTPVSVADVIARCNDAFPNLPVEKQTLSLPVVLTIHAGFSATKRRGLHQAGDHWFEGGKGRPGIAHTTLPVSIICMGNSEPRSAELPPPRAGNTLYSIALDVSPHGDRCPKAVTVKAYADYRWPAKSRMRLLVDNSLPKVRIVETKKVTFAGKTFHRAEAQFQYKLDPGQKTFKLKVDGGEKSSSKTIDINCPPFKVTSAWLKYEVEDKPTCPKKVKEIATFHTTRPGWVKHEIRMQGGLVVSSGKLTSKRLGDKYFATAVRNLTMNAIDKEFIADAVDYPANSGWVPLKVDCLKLSGDFSFVDQGAPQCPRTGRTFISFKSNMPDDVHYSLDCSNGKHFSGQITPVRASGDEYVAAVTRSFDVEKTSTYSCALQSVLPGPVKLHKWKSHTFDCVQRSVETGPVDLRVAPKPHARPPVRKLTRKPTVEKRRRLEKITKKRRRIKVRKELPKRRHAGKDKRKERERAKKRIKRERLISKKRKPRKLRNTRRKLQIKKRKVGKKARRPSKRLSLQAPFQVKRNR